MNKFLNGWDNRLLSQYLNFYLDLESGTRSPTTLSQQHFVDVCFRRLSPKTQHEIAFGKWRDVQSKKNRPSLYPRKFNAPPGPDVEVNLLPKVERVLPTGDEVIEPTAEIFETVDTVETALLASESDWGSETLGNIVQLYREGKAHGKRWSSDAAVWAATALSDPNFQLQLDRWTRDQWGGLSDIYTKAIDGSYLDGLKAGEEHISPWVHRILDHDIGTSFQRVRDALPDDTFSDEVIGWLQAYASDLVTPAGVPLVSLSLEQLDAFEKLAGHFGIPESWLRDALTFTGTEVIASALPAIALALSWNRAEADTFAEICGSLLIGAGVAANPILALVALAALARAWDKSRHDMDMGRVAKSIAAGAALSGVVLATSAAIAGPPLVGIIAGIGVAATLRKNARNWDDSRLIAWLTQQVRFKREVGL